MDKTRKKTDKRLKTLENKIKKTYRDAAKELTETIETYFSAFEEEDEKQKKRLSDGVITENQYKLWRMNKIATGNRYKALRDKLANRMTQAQYRRDRKEDATAIMDACMMAFLWAAHNAEGRGAKRLG